jgi:RNA polymerase sigma-70 factor (ECF subfamily)
MKSPMPPRFPGSVVIPLLPIASAALSADARAKLHEEIANVFDQLRDPLLRYLWTFGLEVPDGEEVLQDVFLSLFRHLERGKPVDNVRGWLFRVAHNLALRRRDRARRAAETQLDTGNEDRTADPAPNPEDRMADRQTRQRVLAVVEALPEQDRRCLFLRAEGLRYREIAGILDMSLGAVSVSLSRSLARIARSAERSGS